MTCWRHPRLGRLGAGIRLTIAGFAPGGRLPRLTLADCAVGLAATLVSGRDPVAGAQPQALSPPQPHQPPKAA